MESKRISLGDIETTASLAEAGFRVIATDQRGCGEAGYGASVGSYAISSLVDDDEAALDALGIERAHLVGHDWGGMVG